MRYLIIEYEPNELSHSVMNTSDSIKSVMNELGNDVHFIGDYPNKESAQCCSVIRERLIKETS